MNFDWSDILLSDTNYTDEELLLYINETLRLYS